MTPCAVVVDRYDGVVIRLGQSPYHVCGALLHFRVGSLHGIQLNTRGVATRINRRNGPATHTNAVIVSA